MEELNNPVWSSLLGPHRDFAMGDGHARRYSSDVAPFVAIDWKSPGAWSDLCQLLTDSSEEVVLVGGPMDFDFSGFRCTKQSLADQMVFDGSPPQVEKAEIVQLDAIHNDLMLGLTKKVYPGYFRQKTQKMGRYYGIFAENQLVAMAGERLRPSENFQELSGICTDSDFRGKGYAAKLTGWATNMAFAANRQPFLHVDSDNKKAIGIYHRLGFRKRISLVIRRLQKNITGGSV